LKALRTEGRIAGIVERFIAQAGKFGKRKDLFGFIDIVAIDPADGIVGVQSCGQAFSEHVHKLVDGEELVGESYEALQAWLRHAKLELWGWRKVKLKRGGKAMRWSPRIADFFLEEDGTIGYTERK